MKFLLVFGTRPECIKIAPIIAEFERRGVCYMVCVTAQHRQMLDPFLSFFGIHVNEDLGIMKAGQDLYYVTTRVLQGLRDVLKREQPDVVIVQGDTTTAFATSLAAFYEKVPIAHVEAGLRTHDLNHPFPEEVNRRLIDHMATWLFASTDLALRNLLCEGLNEERIHVTGNTIVDALTMILQDQRFKSLVPPIVVTRGHRLLLVTAHRRESFGAPFESLCRALRRLVEANPDVEIVYPVHLNPHVQEPVNRLLSGISRIHLIPPLPYLPFLKLMEQAYLILTDSGGVQEEAPTLKKPVLVLRDVTERPEGIELGVARLVGTSEERIVRETQRILNDPEIYEAMCSRNNPYGDGQAAKRIVATLALSSNCCGK